MFMGEFDSYSRGDARSLPRKIDGFPLRISNPEEKA